MCPVIFRYKAGFHDFGHIDTNPVRSSWRLMFASKAIISGITFSTSLFINDSSSSCHVASLKSSKITFIHVSIKRSCTAFVLVINIRVASIEVAIILSS